MFDLTGKCALVTGATGGIGGAIASALAAQGATVALSGRNEAKLAEVQAGIPGSMALAADLSTEGAAADLIKRAETELGQLDILVNNAGLTRDGLTMRMSNDDFREVIDVNLTASFRMIKASLRGMMKRRHGRIINITSVIGHTGNAGQANYAASKAGLAAISKSVAEEVATRGITVNCIAPGFIATAMTDAVPEAIRQTALDSIPMGRMGTTDEIASAVVFLASSESGYITGTTLHINGGAEMF